MDFTGKVAIVTGASSGIGASTAKLFATNGVLLTIVGRNEARLRRTAEACEQVKGNKPVCVLLDLTLPNSCEEVVKKTIEKHKRLDILVNCAGKVILTSLFDNDMEAFDDLVAINLRVPYKMTQLCIPHLKLSKGHIINVFGAGGQSMRARPGFMPFGMIRDAMERFTKAGGLELAQVGVRMNAVRPGITRTNFLSNFNIDEEVMEQTYDYLSHMMPGNAVLEPEEIARMILFVASDTCPSMNGANLYVDGASSYA